MSEHELIRAVAHKSDPTHTLEVTKVAVPAAGGDFTHTFDPAFVRRILAVSATFVTSAVVASRALRLDLIAPEGRVLSALQSATIAASLTTAVSWGKDLGNPDTSLFDGACAANFPDVIVPGGWTIQSVTAGIDVADQYSNILVLVEKVESLPYTHYKEKLAAWRGEAIERALAGGTE